MGANPGNLNSGWGLPVAVLGQSGLEDVLVLEMGASAPGEIAHLTELAQPTVGCVTNIGEAHLENFGTLSGVLRTKAALVEGLPPEGCAVLPRDDDHFFDLVKRNDASRMLSFGSSPRSDVCLEQCEQTADGLKLRINGVEGNLPVFGEMNGLNAVAACA